MKTDTFLFVLAVSLIGLAAFGSGFCVGWTSEKDADRREQFYEAQATVDVVMTRLRGKETEAKR